MFHIHFSTNDKHAEISLVISIVVHFVSIPVLRKNITQERFHYTI